MDDITDLLQLAKEVAVSASKKLDSGRSDILKEHKFSQSVTREVKALADSMMDDFIIERLVATGIPILSEESGELQGTAETDLKFVVDPLDGTVNFVRGLGECAVSIALYRNDSPVFGVLATHPARKLAWGGRGLGAYLNDTPIEVSAVTESSKGVLCTGFPSRFNFENGASFSAYIKQFSCFSKIRMLGAASLSLLKVAEGAAEAYMENDIMLWDVAAGLAIVEGAGGIFSVSPGSATNSLNVCALNGKIRWPQ